MIYEWVNFLGTFRNMRIWTRYQRYQYGCLIDSNHVIHLCKRDGAKTRYF